MKKMTLLAIAFVAISVASCKKDYTCTCRDVSGQTTEVTPMHDTKSSATTACSARKSAPEVCTIN